MISMGTEISDDDLLNIQYLADQVRKFVASLQILWSLAELDVMNLVNVVLPLKRNR